MTRSLLRLLAPVCLVLALVNAACSGPVITERSFAGRCLTYTPGGISDDTSCGSQPRICDQFKAVVYAEYQSRQQCIDACTSLKSQLYQQYALGSCRESVRYAWVNCSNYCRANYP